VKKVYKLTLLSLFLMIFSSYASAQYKGEMINAHLHFLGNIKTELLLKELSKENTQAAILMPKFYTGGGPYDGKDVRAEDHQVEALYKSHPTVFFPLIGLQRDQFCDAINWSREEIIRAMEVEIAEKLSSGMYFGAGELKVIHWAYGKHQNSSKRIKNCSEVNHNLDSPLVLAMLGQLKKFNKPLVIHMEASPKGVSQLKKVLPLGAKIVWAHNCGRAHPEVIRDLLRQFDNLFCDLANMDDRGFYGSGQPRTENFTYLIMRNGILDEVQKRLMEDFPGRFMAGTDVAHTGGFEKQQVSKRLNRMRLMLGQLSSATAKKVAYQNAIQIFELPLKTN
jgi:hypothetical protein